MPTKWRRGADLPASVGDQAAALMFDGYENNPRNNPYFVSGAEPIRSAQ